MTMDTSFMYSVLCFVLVGAQFQPSPEQFGGQQGVVDARQQQQQLQGGPGQQQQPAGEFGNQQQSSGGRSFPAGTFGQNGVNQPQQPSMDQFGATLPNQNQLPMHTAGTIQGANSNFAGSAVGGQVLPVKIITDLLAVDLAQHADKLTWAEPRSDTVYCVSSNPAASLQFVCYDCNGTYGQQFNEYLRSATNLQSMTGYPAIRLNSVPIIGEELYMRTLSCVATYGTAPNGAPLNTTASSSLLLQFLSAPLIVDQQAHGPLYAGPQDGYQFYVPQQGGFTLFCMARGNPPPASYNWTVNGAPLPNAGNAPQLRVDAQTYAGKAITCKVYSHVYPHGKESAPVGISAWIAPTLTANNFQDIQQQQTGLFEKGTTNVQLGKRATFQCTVAGLPIPWIWWRQETSPGQVINATCDGGRQDGAPTLGANGYTVTSQCVMEISSYEKTGRYWCSGCNYLSAGTYQCLPEEKQGSSSGVKIDVVGQPLISQNEPPRYEQEEQGVVKVGVVYCANPEPVLPDGLFWEINGQRLNIQSQVENYRAESPEQNTTSPNCWIARLRISHVSEADRSKTFRLTATNQMGTVFREFQLSSLNATGSTSGGDRAVGLAVGLTLGLLLVVLFLICALCWWKKLLCFANGAKRHPVPSQPKQSKEKLQSNIAPEDSKHPPGVIRPSYDLPPTEPVHVNGTSSPNGRRKREGLNYAEFDLVKDSHRTPQSAPGPAPQRPPPTDYVRLQQPTLLPTQLKSPTNSTV